MKKRGTKWRPLALVVLSAWLLLFAGCGSGTTGHNPGAPSWRYVALGDSLATGAIAQQGYVPRYAAYVNTDTGANINTTNLGVPGWHSADLLNAVQNDPAFRADLGGAQVITFDIGGNDLANAHEHFVAKNCGGADGQDCLRSGVSTFEQNWSALLPALLQLRGTGNAIIRTMDIYNPYVAADMKSGIFGTVEPYLDQVNAYIHSTAAANGIPVASVHQAFNGADGTQDPGAQGLLAPDGFHPNDAGHKVIADQLRTLGYGPLH